MVKITCSIGHPVDKSLVHAMTAFFDSVKEMLQLE